ncbi:MAG: hypothetical protein AB7P21_18045 [Lautropia sp.]
MQTRHVSTAAMLLAMSFGAWAQVGEPTTTPRSPAVQPTPGVVSPATRDTVRPGTMAGDATRRNPNRSTAQFDADRDQLENALARAQSRDDYRATIEREGYTISAINDDRPEYLEYEVVKGGRSYEVQLEFDDGARRATDIDVANNLWRADSTERMMEDSNWRPTAPLVADPERRFSDRRYMAGWTTERERLQQTLRPNQDVQAVRTQLEQLGYRITAVNDRDPDYLEYEIVKGDNSYEVQIDVDEATRRATEIDVAANLWEADSTERRKTGS